MTIDALYLACLVTGLAGVAIWLAIGYTNKPRIRDKCRLQGTQR